MAQSSIFSAEFNEIGRLWKRAIAYLADGFVLAVPTLVIVFGYIFFVSGGNFKQPNPESMQSNIVLEILLRLVSLSYFTYFVGKTGQSPGKKAMGLKVVDFNGSVVGYKKACVRYLFFVVYSLGVIGGIIFVISAIMASVDKQKRTLHDRLCRTLVIGRELEPSIQKIKAEGKPKVSGAAIFGFLLSIFCVVIPIVGQLICFYVCGRVLYDIKQSNGLLKGKFFAIGGIIISGILLIGFAILFLFVIPRSR